jgi:hypothetical protein
LYLPSQKYYYISEEITRPASEAIVFKRHFEKKVKKIRVQRDMKLEERTDPY